MKVLSRVMGNWFSVPSRLPSKLDKSYIEYTAFKIERLVKRIEDSLEDGDKELFMDLLLDRLQEVQLNITKPKNLRVT